MTSKVLLIEEDPVRAQQIHNALSNCGVETFRTGGAAEAEEALAIRRFDVVLLSSLVQPPEVLTRIQSAVRRLCPSAKFLVWGTCEAGFCDVVVPAHVSERELASELGRARQPATPGAGDAANTLPVFDLTGFRQNMGDDRELMREVVGIFFEESAGQMQELSEKLASGDTTRVSRLAHSLKGSLGSLHAARARHWAQALEVAAAAGDSNHSRTALEKLSQAIDELTPNLRDVLS